MNNKVIGNFMEFEHFTKVVSLVRYAFQSSTLTGIKFPQTITSVGTDAFRGCGRLTKIYLNEGLLDLSRPFYECGNLPNITIPSTVTALGNDTFYRCTALASIIMLPTTPPTISGSWFRYNTGGKVYVPDNSVETYKAASGWSTYASKIYPMSEYTDQ